MNTKLTTEETKFWRDCANDWKIASCALDSIELRMMEHGITAVKACKALNDAMEAVSDQCYMFSPQSEWLGGDLSLTKNYCVRPPHIATD